MTDKRNFTVGLKADITEIVDGKDEKFMDASINYYNMDYPDVVLVEGVVVNSLFGDLVKEGIKKAGIQ